MATPFIGEIRMFAGNFSPANWALCNGQVLAISQYEALFQLIGTTYGGDGVNTFALPNLQGRAPIHQGNLSGGANYIIGELSGSETVTLTTNQIPSHNHPLQATTGSGTGLAPTGLVMATPTGIAGPQTYVTPTAVTALANTSTIAGGSLPHDNMQPYLVINFIIALFGIFPTQN
jgi:microcystin-dependent protein